MNDTTRSIIAAGIMAPSGDNCQPWRFSAEENRILVFNRPERDTSQYNYRQRASYIAHGALIENMVIAASAHGLKADVALFPEGPDSNAVAEVRLLAGTIEPDPLAEAIPQRCTNRRRYQGGTLDREQRESLISAANGFPYATVRIFSGSEQEQVARVIGLNDRLVFENQDLHAFLFDHIRWNDAEAIETRDGMDIKTLELAAPDALAFRLFKSFDLVQLLNLFGISRIIGANGKKLAMSASAIGVITMPTREPVDYITSGRAMERIWLEATRQGLAFQLMTGITCLMGRVADNDTGTLTPGAIQLIENATRPLESLYGSQVPSIIFRVGKATGPTARSLRQQPLL